MGSSSEALDARECITVTVPRRTGCVGSRLTLAWWAMEGGVEEALEEALDPAHTAAGQQAVVAADIPQVGEAGEGRREVLVVAADHPEEAGPGPPSPLWKTYTAHFTEADSLFIGADMEMLEQGKTEKIQAYLNIIGHEQHEEWFYKTRYKFTMRCRKKTKVLTCGGAGHMRLNNGRVEGSGMAEDGRGERSGEKRNGKGRSG